MSAYEFGKTIADAVTIDDKALAEAINEADLGDGYTPDQVGDGEVPETKIHRDIVADIEDAAESAGEVAYEQYSGESR